MALPTPYLHTPPDVRYQDEVENLLFDILQSLAGSSSSTPPDSYTAGAGYIAYDKGGTAPFYIVPIYKNGIFDHNEYFDDFGNLVSGIVTQTLPLFNTNEIHSLTNATTFNNGEYHSITITCINGGGDIIINGVTAKVPEGYTCTYTASRFIANTIEVVPHNTDGVIVNTIK